MHIALACTVAKENTLCGIDVELDVTWQTINIWGLSESPLGAWRGLILCVERDVSA